MTILETRPTYCLEIRTVGTDSPRRARRWLAWVLEVCALAQDTVDAAVLVVSELVTNAVTHSDSPRIVVSAEVRPGGLRIVVHDDGDAAAPDSLPVDLDEHGRGLLLVRALADVHVHRHQHGRTVSALIPAEQAL